MEIPTLARGKALGKLGMGEALTQLSLKILSPPEAFLLSHFPHPILPGERVGGGKDSKGLQKECTFKIQKSNGDQAPLLRVFRPQLPAS